MFSEMSLESFVASYGYAALLVGTFVEGETILIIGGIFAQLGYLDLYAVMMIAFAGSFSGDQVSFAIGRLKGRDLLARHPSWEDRVDRVHILLERYHDLIMVGFRFVYGMRIITPFVIGMGRHIRARRFIVLNAIGALLWSVAISMGGYLFGHAIEKVTGGIKHYEIAVTLAVSAVGAFLWLIHKLRGKRKY